MNSIIINKGFKDIFNDKFEICDTGFSDGKANMKFDSDRANNLLNGTQIPMFRLYGWKPWAVSLGANQNSDDIDLDKCNELGFDVVRRPTGGRAVLHADEITYSVVTNLNNHLSPSDVYRAVHSLLLKSFLDMGCKDLDFEKSQPNFKELYTQKISVSCFASTARYEIEYKGRKVVGSAQRVLGNILLQHGSILLGNGYEILTDVIKGLTEENRKKLKDYTLSHSATLSDSAGRKINYDEVAHYIIKNLNKNM